MLVAYNQNLVKTNFYYIYTLGYEGPKVISAMHDLTV